MNKRLKAADIAAMTASATHRVLAAKAPSDISDVSVIALNVADVDFYDKNPRQHRNAKYEEIKASIKTRGLESSLFVTKRPGSQRYMVARGGNTRLEILQDLAKEDPGKWQKLTFMEVPWTCESEILAAHLVENTGRSDLCFWDAAQALHHIKEQMQAERGKPISGREFPDLLKSRGIEVGRAELTNGDFALNYLATLDKWQSELAVRHVSHKIAPAIHSLHELWLLKSGAAGASYVDLVRAAVAVEGGAADQPYSPDLLIALVVAAVAQDLGLPTEAVASLLAKGQTQWPSLQALHDALQAPGGVQEDDATVTGGSVNQQPALHQSSVATPQQQTDIPGIAGVTVRTGLTPLAPKPRALAQGDDDYHAHGIHGGPLTAQELALLEQEGPEGLARRAFWSELQALAELAGIADLLMTSTSAYLPYRFYVELPAPGKLGVSPDDVAVQAWWLLSGISGQVHTAITPYLQDPEASMESGEPALKDTGPGCFAHLLLHPELLEEVIKTCLGSDSQSLSDLMLLILTYQDHPLYEALIRLLDACANWNTARRPI